MIPAELLEKVCVTGIGELWDSLICLSLCHLDLFVPWSRWPLKCLNRIVCKQKSLCSSNHMTQMSMSFTIWCSCYLSFIKYSQPCRTCKLLLPQSHKLEHSKTPWTHRRPERTYYMFQCFGRYLGDLQREVLWIPQSILAQYKSSSPALRKPENLTIDMWKS